MLKGTSRRESSLVALNFETTETRGGPSAANRARITSVERDDSGIHVNYDLAARLDVGSHEPQGEAKDDLGNDYNNLGSHVGLARGGWRGRLTMPLPPAAATTLRIRITWDASLSSIWDGPAHEIRVSLPD